MLTREENLFILEKMTMLTLVDDYSIHVGDNVLFAPNVILRPIDKIILNTVIKI